MNTCEKWAGNNEYLKWKYSASTPETIYTLCCKNDHIQLDTKCYNYSKTMEVTQSKMDIL